jgi:hypothetical protein
MLYGIVHRFCHGNHDITINIIVEVKALFGIVNEAFNHTDVLYDRRDLDTNGVHGAL